MSKKPWEDKVSDEELEEVVDADFLDDEDEFEDFEEVFAVSTEVGNNYHTARSPLKRLGQYFLRLFAPLL